MTTTLTFGEQPWQEYTEALALQIYEWPVQAEQEKLQSLWQQLAWKGLSFIVRQWHLGFAEACHIMIFPRIQGFRTAQEHQYGDIFQRALIADTLCDADQLLHGHLKPVIDHEVSYLLRHQCTSVVGGWSYFPNLPELPADTDDLAQVMQVLLRSGRRAEIVNYCETPLEVLLQDNAHADGSLETWIVPVIEQTLEKKRQAEFAQVACGTGPDTNVMANLLYALTLYDQTRFAETIQKGITYLETQQQANGSWISTWYHGPYYGTYVCLRLLAVAHPNSLAIGRALNFLRSHQHDDGGWGMEDASDPLSTALTLLGLAAVYQYNGDTDGDIDDNDRARAELALHYLQQCQEHDDAWTDCQLIRMELGRATGHVQKILSYGSRTMTTTFVTKAALAWHRLTAGISVFVADAQQKATAPALIR